MHWNHELAAFILSGGVRYKTGDLLAYYHTDSLDEVRKAQEETFADMPDMNLLYKAIDLPVSSLVESMHSHGILIDPQQFARVREELVEKRDTFRKRINDRLGAVNPNSPKQLGEALTDTMKIKLPKTASGQYATGSGELVGFAKAYPVVQDILDHRAVDKIITTYIDPVVAKVDKDNRIHPVYDLMSAATGRLVSSDPNIQSTPIGKPYGDLIRGCFIAPPDGVLIGFDYSQQELRILAHLSGDEKLMDAFSKGHDVHVITAAKVFNMPEEMITKDLRNIGKTLNFGIIYGETPYGLARQLGKSVEECAHILKTYFETYPHVKRYFDNLLTGAKIHGYVETICGRRRSIPGLPMGKGTKYIAPAQERVLKNFPIQGSAADMTKKAMVALATHLLPRYPKADLVMQIHDELIFEFHSKEKSEIDRFAKDVHDTMANALPLRVPIVVDWIVGKTWAEVK